MEERPPLSDRALVLGALLTACTVVAVGFLADSPGATQAAILRQGALAAAGAPSSSATPWRNPDEASGVRPSSSAPAPCLDTNAAKLGTKTECRPGCTYYIDLPTLGFGGTVHVRSSGYSNPAAGPGSVRYHGSLNLFGVGDRTYACTETRGTPPSLGSVLSANGHASDVDFPFEYSFSGLSPQIESGLNANYEPGAVQTSPLSPSPNANWNPGAVQTTQFSSGPIHMETLTQGVRVPIVSGGVPLPQEKPPAPLIVGDSQCDTYGCFPLSDQTSVPPPPAAPPPELRGSEGLDVTGQTGELDHSQVMSALLQGYNHAAAEDGNPPLSPSIDGSVNASPASPGVPEPQNSVPAVPPPAVEQGGLNQNGVVVPIPAPAPNPASCSGPMPQQGRFVSDDAWRTALQTWFSSCYRQVPRSL